VFGSFHWHADGLFRRRILWCFSIDGGICLLRTNGR
jgi:hypothetical protein